MEGWTSSSAARQRSVHHAGTPMDPDGHAAISVILERLGELEKHDRDCHTRVRGDPLPGVLRGPLDVPLREELVLGRALPQELEGGHHARSDVSPIWGRRCRELTPSVACALLLTRP